MVDFTAKLREERAKEALEKQLAKIKKDSAPNLNPFAGSRKKKEEEPPPPDLSQLEIPPIIKLKLRRLLGEHVALSQTERVAKKQKKEITDNDIKPLCKLYKLDKFMFEGERAAYFRTDRTSISRDLLLINGVSPEVITKCTVITESWAFKISSKKGEEDSD